MQRSDSAVHGDEEGEGSVRMNVEEAWEREQMAFEVNSYM